MKVTDSILSIMLTLSIWIQCKLKHQNNPFESSLGILIAMMQRIIVDTTNDPGFNPKFYKGLKWYVRFMQSLFSYFMVRIELMWIVTKNGHYWPMETTDENQDTKTKNWWKLNASLAP